MPWQSNNNSSGPNNPWGQGGGNRGNNPWGQGGGGRGPGGGGGGRGPGGGGPDLEELIRKGQDRLKQGLPSGIGGPRLVALLIVAILVLWLLSGIYQVRPGEVGVVTTFGRYTTEAGEGLQYHLPSPIQSVVKVNVEQIRQTRIGDNATRLSRRRAEAGLNETLMLTGDENIVDIQFTVVWRVASARDFLFNIQDPQEETVKVVAESALREIIGRTPIQNALTTGKGQIQSETRTLMQELLDGFGAGITIQEVQLQEVDPPQQVIDAFRDVQAAEADRETLVNQAERYANQRVPEARGQAERMIQQAEAYKAQVVSRAQGEASRFLSVFEEYAKAKDVTRRRLYLETMEEILDGMDKILLDGDGGSGVVPYLPLNELRKSQGSGSARGENE